MTLGRPRGGDEPRRDRAGRPAAGTVPQSGDPVRRRASSARPAMNFLPCQVVDGTGGGLAVRVNDQIVLPVPAGARRSLRPVQGQARWCSVCGRSICSNTTRTAKPGCGAGRAAGGRGRADGHGDAWCTSSSAATRSAPASIRRPMPHPDEMLPLTADMNNMHLMEPDTGGWSNRRPA